MKKNVVNIHFFGRVKNVLSFVVFFCVNFESQKIYEAESCYNDSVTIQGHKVELKQKNKKKIQCET